MKNLKLLNTMMNFKSALGIIIISIAFLSSCRKEKLPESYFTYKGDTFELNDGILEYWGSFSKVAEGYNFDISLFSAGLYFDTETKSLVGSGEMIYFETFSPSDLGSMPTRKRMS